jgi:large subunit ribosomal protein L19
MDDQNKKDKTEEIAEEIVEEAKEEPVAEEAVEEEIAEEEVAEEKTPVAKGKPVGFDDFRVGDTIRIFYKIIEGDKLRTQPYEGIVISKRGEGESRSFTVRRIGADSVGIERIFPASSPNIDSIKITKRGKVRRAKLYFLRGKVGRAAMRIKEIKK